MVSSGRIKIISLVLVVFFVLLTMGIYSYLNGMHTDNRNLPIISPGQPGAAHSTISEISPTPIQGVTPDATRIGPGLPPPDGLAFRLIPANYELEQNGVAYERLDEYQYPVQSLEFPNLSPYSGTGYFGTSGDTKIIMIQIWYFNDYKKFTAMQGQLLKYLTENGRTDPVLLNLTMQRPDWNSTCEEKQNATLRVQCYGPALHPLKQFRVTRYSDGSTAGYFFATEHPLISSREDYFIEYYGIFNASQPVANLENLSELMERNNGYGLKGNLHEIQEYSSSTTP